MAWVQLHHEGIVVHAMHFFVCVLQDTCIVAVLLWQFPQLASPRELRSFLDLDLHLRGSMMTS